MNYLLDTCSFLWWALDPAQLSHDAKAIIQSSENSIFLSCASCWEIIIKYLLGRLELPMAADDFITNEQQNNYFSLLDIEPAHIFQLLKLPDIHKDPFDRVLVAQAQIEKLGFITNDSIFRKYNITVVW